MVPWTRTKCARMCDQLDSGLTPTQVAKKWNCAVLTVCLMGNKYC